MQYAPEALGKDDDDGTMPENVAALSDAVIGQRIVSVERDVGMPDRARPGRYYSTRHGTVITLGNGKKVRLVDTADCCAFTELESFLLHPELVDHIITGVGTTGGYSTWHIYADLGDVLELSVSWSCGNPFYYGYGFDIRVEPVAGA